MTLEVLSSMDQEGCPVEAVGTGAVDRMNRALKAAGKTLARLAMCDAGGSTRNGSVSEARSME